MHLGDKRDEINQYNLLPRTHQYQTRVRQLIRSWLGVLSVLVATLAGVAIATLVERHRLKLARHQLATTAEPLLELRQQVSLIQEDSARLSRLCELVETSRPNDDLLQTIAAIASSTKAEELLVDSVRIRLPSETKSAEPANSAEIVIEAHVDSDATESWLRELKNSKRIATPKVVEHQKRHQLINGTKFGANVKQAIELHAVPRTSMVLP